ncbi:putative nucleotide binding protein 2 (nbp 2) [Schistosoma mansoni]|uniref:putative nucleotide binding protein 2 (nbp 2) n=1 Tax=Schistosoma mansoni TaxID=6183 RepID=UPI00022DBED8|nr:putative nucleotide binding protein 2 (nbp 2) [Schistosoma mansoni]|eukprot:XP_018649206.1 putative nucleotide binding protein 2 (nbp 2) [Schistosoma mansoni]
MTVDRCIYVGNINPRITADILYELFLQAGPLEGVTVKDTFAFVTFEDEESVPYACSLFEGITLYGTELRIRPRQNSKFQDLKIRSVPPSAYQFFRPRVDPSYSAPIHRSHFNESTDYVNHTSHRRDPFLSFTPPAGNRHLAHEIGYNYYSRYEHNLHPLPSYDLPPYGWQHGPPVPLENRLSERRRSNEYSRHMSSAPTASRRERSPYSRYSSSRPDSSYNNRGFSAGILDIDLCGPSIPRILGLENNKVSNSKKFCFFVYSFM